MAVVVSNAKELNPLQRVSAFLMILGPGPASEVLKHFDDENEVERVALEIASLQKLSQEALEEILAEFYTFFEASGYVTTGGVNVAREILEHAYGSDQADCILRKLVATLQTSPFDFFNNADPLQLAASFQNENPQMVALVLAYIKAETSANILSALSPDMQLDVARRIAHMDRTNPEILKEVDRILSSRFSSLVNSDYTQVGGVESLAEIINHSDRATEKAILDEMERKDPELANDIRELMFVFEDIIKIDDRSIQRILREVETKDLALALKGSNVEVKEKIFNNMSERASAMLNEDMEYMGAVRAKDVQEKQTIIVGIIRALEAAGEIALARAEEDDDFIT
jgi:flagellar motor switch protein FliG